MNRESDMPPSIFTISGFRIRSLVHRLQARWKRPFWRRERMLWVDVTILAEHDARTGIQRVTRAISAELLRNPPNGWLVSLIRFDISTRQFRYADRPMQTLACRRIRQLDSLLHVRKGDLVLGLDLTPMHLELMVNSLRHLRRKGVRLIHVLYDMLAIRHPEWWVGPVGTVLERWAELVTMHSDGIVGISQAVTEDYKHWLFERGLPAPASLSWFHLGADVNNSLPSTGLPLDASETLSAMRGQPCFLMVGTLEPRKGHRQALEAFELLWEEGIAAHLVVVGKEGWGVDELIEKMRTHPHKDNRLFLLEGVSDEYLEAIYRNCTVLLAASEGEGFGLPLIEAARHGLPILARDLDVFREVAGNQATYFKGNDPLALADAIRMWLSEMDVRERPPEIGWLTWAESADQLVAALGLPRRKNRPST
jgi:glycosyltransferase involved in cell wall biosynthesis